MEKSLLYKTKLTCSRCSGSMILETDMSSRRDISFRTEFYQCLQCGIEVYRDRDEKAVAIELLNKTTSKGLTVYTKDEVASLMNIPITTLDNWSKQSNAKPMTMEEYKKAVKYKYGRV